MRDYFKGSNMRRKPKPIFVESSHQRASSWALTLTVGLLPLVFWPTAGDANLVKPLLLIAGLVVTISILGVRAASGDRPHVKWNVLDFCVGLYTLVVCASWIYSAYRSAALGVIRADVTYAILYFTARVILTNDRARARLVLALIWSCTAVSLIGVYERFGNLPWGNPDAISATWFNRTYLAAYLLLAIPIAVWAVLDKRTAYRVAGVAALLAAVPALAYTAAKIAWLGVVPMLAVALVGAWPLLIAEKKRLVAKMVILALMLGGAFQVVPSQWFPQRSPAAVVAKALATGADSSNIERLGFMKAAVRVGMQHLVLGGGAGTYGIYAPENTSHDCYVCILSDPSVHGSAVFSHAHNEFLEVFAELGVVGLVTFVSIPLAAGWMVRWVLRCKDVKAGDKWLAVALLVGITGFLAANLVGRSARVPGEAGFMYLLLALLGSLNYSFAVQENAPEPRGFRRNALVATASGTCLLLLAIGWSAVSELRSSIYIARGESLLTDAYNSNGAANAVNEFQTACKLTPTDPGAWYELGNALAVSGRHYEALDAYEVVEKLSPSYGRLHFNQGTSLFNLRRYSDAEYEMTRAYKQDGLPDSRTRLEYLRNLLRPSRK
ncbi:MAG: O-antigen ligase family protein [Armatimonadota bacterium]